MKGGIEMAGKATAKTAKKATGKAKAKPSAGTAVKAAGTEMVFISEADQ